MDEKCNLESLKGRNWIATMMLCWSLGAFGAHRFYTGKTTSAWVMAILTCTGCLTFVSLIWALFDGIMIVLGKFESENGELYEKNTIISVMYIATVILGVLYLLFVLASLGMSMAHGPIPTTPAPAPVVAPVVQ